MNYEAKIIKNIFEIFLIFINSKHRHKLELSFDKNLSHLIIIVDDVQLNTNIYKNSLLVSIDNYINICNKLRDLLIVNGAIYSKLEKIYDEDYSKQSIYLKNIEFVININCCEYKEILMAAKYHKKINNSIIPIKTFYKTKTTYKNNFVR